MYKIKLKQVTFKHLKKPYTYLYLTLPKNLVSSLQPTSIKILTMPSITLHVKVRKDGRGYVFIPSTVTTYFSLKKDQELTCIFPV